MFTIYYASAEQGLLCVVNEARGNVPQVHMDDYSRIGEYEVDGWDAYFPIQLNEVFKHCQEMIGIRSMAVGDMLEHKGKYYLCLSNSWKEIIPIGS